MSKNPVVSKNFIDAINLCIDNKLSQYNFISYAKIVKVNDNYTIDAQPVAKSKVKNVITGTVDYKEYPIIYGIPYLYVAKPIVGDNCVLLHFDKNVSEEDNAEAVNATIATVGLGLVTGLQGYLITKAVKYIKGTNKKHALDNCVAICGFKNIYNNLDVTEEEQNTILKQKQQSALESHPIHSLYITTDPTNPAEIFGGFWEQIVEVFPFAASQINTQNPTYAPSSNSNDGGEFTHTLTIDEMPAHGNHLYKKDSWMGHGDELNKYLENTTLSDYVGSNAARGWYQSYGNEIYPAGAELGGNQPHNTMPPYKVFYMWYRITEEELNAHLQ